MVEETFAPGMTPVDGGDGRQRGDLRIGMAWLLPQERSMPGP